MRIQRVPASRLDQPETVVRNRRRTAVSRPGKAGRPRDRRSRNERLVRTVWEAYQRRELDEVRRHFSPSARIHVEQPPEAAGDYVGLDPVLERLRRVESEKGPNTGSTLHDVLASPAHVVVLYDVRAGDGSTSRRVGVYHIARNLIRDLTITAGPTND